MGTLSGKVAWVTGAGTGIGLAGAQALAAAGATVVMSGRRGDILEREAGAIRKAGGKAEVEALDVSHAAAVKQTAERILERHGQVDMLVNSAGLNNPQRFWRDQTVESWDQVIRINLDGTFYCTQAVIPAMRKRKDGLVINISSWAGKYTSAMVGAAYNGSKAAVGSLTETINMEECINGIRACHPAEVAPPTDRRPYTLGRGARQDVHPPFGPRIRWVAEQPANVPKRTFTSPDVEPVVRRWARARFQNSASNASSSSGSRFVPSTHSIMCCSAMIRRQ
jgi:NAD(P)-dependent dehydrogenase (short-subunit alcohol dehydrogenase family)